MESTGPAQTQPVPLHHIFFLEEAPQPRTYPMGKQEAILALTRYFPVPSDVLEGMDQKAHFSRCVDLVANVQSWKLEYVPGFEELRRRVATMSQQLGNPESQSKPGFAEPIAVE